ncbi:MAG: recombination mediator RecR [Bacteroidota bacterium]
MQEISSKLIRDAAEQLGSLPGVGKKTALRLVLHLLKRSDEEVEQFAHAFIRMKKQIKNCKRCNNLSDTELCEICSNPRRSNGLICVVETVKDVLAIESTQQYFGSYHVLGGVISPMEGIGPGDLSIGLLIERCTTENPTEIILALNSTMEGDTTNFYLYKKLSPLGVKISTLARGLAFGDELEYADELTLGKSIINRTPFEG